MSVINDMLAALDARRAPPVPGTTVVSLEHGTTKSRRWRVMVVLGTAAVAATALADWPVLLSSAQRTPQPPAIVADALAPTVANPAARADALAPPVATAPAAVRRVLQASVAPRAVAQAAPMATAAVAQTAALTPPPRPRPSHCPRRSLWPRRPCVARPRSIRSHRARANARRWPIAKPSIWATADTAARRSTARSRPSPPTPITPARANLPRY